VLGGALALLVRTLRRTKGGCAGCSGGGCISRPEGDGVVRLGAPPRPGAGCST